MAVRTTTGIVTDKGLGDVQKEADVILTALVVGYAAYHVQQREEVLFTAKEKNLPNLTSVAKSIQQLLGPEVTTQVRTKPSPMTSDPNHPDFIQGVYLMAGDTAPTVDKPLGVQTRPEPPGDAVLTNAGAALYKNIVTSQQGGLFHNQLYVGPGAYTGMADDNRSRSLINGHETRGTPPVEPQTAWGQPVVVVLLDGTKVLKDGSQIRPDGIQVRKTGTGNQAVVEKRLTLQDKWTPVGPQDASLYAPLDLGPAEGPFPTAQTVMSHTWADNDPALENLHPRWCPPGAQGKPWGALNPGKPAMPSYTTSVANTALDLKEADPTAVATTKDGVLGYTHGMIQAIYAAAAHGPSYRPYEVVAGDITPKLASCFMCATFMDAAGYPANAVHLGSSDSWIPVYGLFDKHPLAPSSVLMQQNSTGTFNTRGVIRSYNQSWRERCFTYMLLGLGLLGKGAGFLFQPDESKIKDPTHGTAVNEGHAPAYRAVCEYLTQNLRPDFKKLSMGPQALNPGALDSTGVAATLILDALSAHDGGKEYADLTNRVMATLPAAK